MSMVFLIFCSVNGTLLLDLIVYPLYNIGR
nr:MAG TPA: hypothetical protein [Caudoviricetes sp.]